MAVWCAKKDCQRLVWCYYRVVEDGKYVNICPDCYYERVGKVIPPLKKWYEPQSVGPCDYP